MEQGGTIKKSPIGDFFSLLHLQPIFYDPLRGDDLIRHDRPWSPSVHENRVYVRGVFWMVDMYVLLP